MCVNGTKITVALNQKDQGSRALGLRALGLGAWGLGLRA